MILILFYRERVKELQNKCDKSSANVSSGNERLENKYSKLRNALHKTKGELKQVLFKYEKEKQEQSDLQSTFQREINLFQKNNAELQEKNKMLLQDNNQLLSKANHLKLRNTYQKNVF